MSSNSPGEKTKVDEERKRVKTVDTHIESGCQKRTKRDRHDQFVKTLPKLTSFYPHPTSSKPTLEPLRQLLSLTETPEIQICQPKILITHYH